ncbi:hypothetical protein [Phytohabitans houttuyneae]|nr:hypothetical protein [Phytohabitans houttuyneae]
MPAATPAGRMASCALEVAKQFTGADAEADGLAVGGGPAAG